MSDHVDEIVREFLVESYEILDQLDRDLVALEETPDDRDRLCSIFRTIHTIKGTSGFLAFPKLEHVTHVGENLLVLLRDGELRLTQEIADGLLAMVDAVRAILAHIESDGAEGDGDYEPLVARLEMLRDPNCPPTSSDEVPSSSGNASETAAPQSSESNEAPCVAKPPSRKRTRRKAEETKTAKSEHECDADATATACNAYEEETAAGDAESKNSRDHAQERPHEETGIAVDETPAHGDTVGPPPVSSAARQPHPEEHGSAERSSAGARSSKKSNPAARIESRRAESSANEPAGDGGDRGGQSVADSTVRIDVHLLDKLMNLVGELVLARNQIMQFCRSTDDAVLSAASQRLNLITTELQEGVMKTRMQPIRNAWSKLPRVVRDLSASCGKHVQVKMEGADTELDKTILEAIKDPLTHIVRNSVDHGIESPADREAAGKPADGTLWLRAFHEGGQVNIEIADDGGGINLQRVREKAIAKGMVTAEQAAGMNDRELTNLILLPGFSTAAKVTNVSGRGVGMDVVKTNVERIGGTLDIHTVPGKGTTLRIKIPLTLAIVPALIVTSERQRFAIPQVSLLELVRLEADRARTDIEVMHDVPVYRLRGKLLPLVFLDEQLRLRQRRRSDEFGADGAVNIVVLQAEDRQFGLVVDQIRDTQEIVVKPLGQHLKGLPVYAGSTIMGDGEVALILDVNGVAQQSNVLTEHRDKSLTDTAGSGRDKSDNRRSWLVIDPGDGTRAAIPLASVARLEEVRRSQIERVGHQDVVQYRGRIMPLVQLASAGFACGDHDQETLQVVVFNQGERSIGVVVGRIVDIVEDTFNDRDPASLHQPKVISGRVTQPVDLANVVRSHIPDFEDFTAA